MHASDTEQLSLNNVWLEEPVVLVSLLKKTSGPCHIVHRPQQQQHPGAVCEQKVFVLQWSKISSHKNIILFFGWVNMRKTKPNSQCSCINDAHSRLTIQDFFFFFFYIVATVFFVQEAFSVFTAGANKHLAAFPKRSFCSTQMCFLSFWKQHKELWRWEKMAVLCALCAWRCCDVWKLRDTVTLMVCRFVGERRLALFTKVNMCRSVAQNKMHTGLCLLLHPPK